MLYGLILIFLTGITWIGTGIVVSLCSTEKVNYSIVQVLFNTLLVILGIPVVLLLPNEGFSLSAICWAAAIMAAAGAGNFFVYYLMEKAMASGPKGIIWGMIQSSCAGTFLMGVFLFDENASYIHWLGLFLIITGILILATRKAITADNTSKSKYAWIIFTIAAFFMMNTVQCLVSLTSFLPGTSGVNPILRTIAYSMGTMLACMTMPAIWKLNRKDLLTRKTVIYSLSMAIITIVSGIIFYQGMDKLAEVGYGSLGYPIATGICILGVFLFSAIKLKEKLGLKEISGLIALLSGIMAISAG